MPVLLYALLCTVLPDAFGQAGDRRDKRSIGARLPEEFVVPPAPVVPPDKVLDTFQIKPGLKLELVASEPLIHDAVAMAFDPDGRIWAAEMRAYMPNVDGTEEYEPIGNIVVLEDTNGDWIMDKRTVFMDGLILPRAIQFAGDGVLVGEPPVLWFCRDTDSDGRCDEKTRVATNYGTRKGNVELMANAPEWNIDNWLYHSAHDYRYRYVTNNGKREWIRNRQPRYGQWGLAEDDYGRLFHNTNSRVLYGHFFPDHYFRRHPLSSSSRTGRAANVCPDGRVWPIRVTPGVNRGYRTLSKTGKISHVTAVCGPGIYRGDLMPEFQGNAFICEPSANLVKRVLLTESNGMVKGKQAYTGSEFLASTDERFRPVNIYTGPDGALYILDLYRGILQHRLSLTTFLRLQILDRGLDKPIGLGRIYRVLPEKAKLGAQPRLSKATAGNLVSFLAHPNGWWRDTAQRLLVERRDKSVVPAIENLALTHSDPLGRLHALWTLEGIGDPNPEVLSKAYMDSSSKVRVAAIRISEAVFKKSFDGKLFARLAGLAVSDDIEVRIQLGFTLGEIEHERATEALMSMARHGPRSNVEHTAILSSLKGRERDFLFRLLADDKVGQTCRKLIEPLSSFTLKSNDPAQSLALLEWLMANPSGWKSAAVAKGMVASGRRKYPIQLTVKPPALNRLLAIERGPLTKLAKPLSDLFAWPGHPLYKIKKPEEFILTREFSAAAKGGESVYLLACAPCHQLTGNGQPGLAPPLAKSPWLKESDETLARIVLHGLKGPIKVNGRDYNLEMPPLNILSDEQISGALSYVREKYGPFKKPVPVTTVKKVRDATKDRESAFTVAELKGKAEK